MKLLFHRQLHVPLAVVVSLLVIPLAALAADFGVDCSWPIHSTSLNCGGTLGDRKAVYDEYMDGCRQKWGSKGAKRCDANEKDRIEMTKRQPQSMRNYTSTGFKKIQAPPAVWNLLSDYWNKNKDDKNLEEWGMGNVYSE